MAFDKKDYQKSETLLLRAERPELAAQFYKVGRVVGVVYVYVSNRKLTCGVMLYESLKSTSHIRYDGCDYFNGNTVYSWMSFSERWHPRVAG